MAGYNPYQTNSYQATQFFPQPQGNVYIINNSMEIANIGEELRLLSFIPIEQFLFEESFYQKQIFQFQWRPRSHHLHLHHTIVLLDFSLKLFCRFLSVPLRHSARAMYS